MKKPLIYLLLCVIIFTPLQAAFSAQETFTILEFYMRKDGRFTYAMEQMKRLHPELSVRTVEQSDSSYILSMLSGTSEIDIVNLYQKQLLENARAGTLLALDTVPQIAEALAESKWLPFEHLLSYDGHLYGIPDYFFVSLNHFNEAAAAECGFQLPQYPYTWQDILLAAQKADWTKEGTLALIRTNTAYPRFLSDYIAYQYAKTGTVNLYTEEFKEALISFKALAQLGAVVDWGTEMGKCIWSGQGDNLVKNPVIGQCPGVTVDMYAFGIPKDSKNLAYAIDFLCTYISTECQIKSYAYVENMFLEDASGYLLPPYESPPQEDQEELRAFIASHWQRSFDVAEFIRYLNDTQIAAQYFQDDSNMPLDRLLKLMQSKVELILSE